MGRAQAAKTDSFAALFGTRRGRWEADLLQATAPSTTARSELRALIEAPTFRESATALRTLYRYRATIDERPLLGELANALCRNSARRVLSRRQGDLRHCLAFCGLRSAVCEQVFYDGPHCLHVCEHGRARGTEVNLTTACGITLGRSDLHPAPRGSWRRPATSGMTRCAICEQHSDTLPDCREAGDEILDSPHGLALTEILTAAIRTHLNDILAGGHAPNGDLLDAAGTEAFGGQLTAYAAQALHADGAAGLMHALGPLHWLKLRQSASVEALAGALDFTDWHDWLLQHRPETATTSEHEFEIRHNNAQTQLAVEVASVVRPPSGQRPAARSRTGRRKRGVPGA